MPPVAAIVKVVVAPMITAPAVLAVMGKVMPPVVPAVKKVVAAMMAEAVMAEVMAPTVVAAAMMTTTTVMATTAAVRSSGDWRDRRQTGDGEREQEGRSKRSARCAIDTGHGVLQGCVA